MSGVWDAIKAESKICKPEPMPGFQGLLAVDGGVPERRWLIGPHPELSRIATGLRNNAQHCAILSSKCIRLGFRKTDCPPKYGVAAQESCGEMQEQAVTDHSLNRQNPIIRSAKEIKQQLKPSVSKPLKPPPDWRKSDEFPNVQSYWATQTPQAHHIVEFNNLEQLGLSSLDGTGELDYKQLPCVLLMAEFHQRYISSALKLTHNGVGANPSSPLGEKLVALDRLRRTYEALYDLSTYADAARPFQSLWEISRIIFEVAEQKVTAAA